MNASDVTVKAAARPRRRLPLVMLAVSATILSGGCATPVVETPTASQARINGVVPRESVAAERCAEQYRMRSLQQGAFSRVVAC